MPRQPAASLKRATSVTGWRYSSGAARLDSGQVEKISTAGRAAGAAIGAAAPLTLSAPVSFMGISMRLADGREVDFAVTPAAVFDRRLGIGFAILFGLADIAVECAEVELFRVAHHALEREFRLDALLAGRAERLRLARIAEQQRHRVRQRAGIARRQSCSVSRTMRSSENSVSTRCL